MSYRIRILSFCFLLLTVSAVSAQDYDLGWERVHEYTAPQEANYTLDWDSIDKQPQAVSKKAVAPAPPKRRAHASLLRKPKASAQSPSAFAPAIQSNKLYNIEFANSQYYDHYKSRYLVVKAVEVETFGQGKYTSETYENRGAWTTYPVYLNGLQEGDRYRVRVIWDDGSNRTIDKTVDSLQAHTIYIGEPDHMAYTSW